MAERYADPSDPLNGPKYRTGKRCIERGCDNPAGTHWSPFWCQPCNAKRMDRIGASLEQMVREFDDAAGVTASAPASATEEPIAPGDAGVGGKKHG